MSRRGGAGPGSSAYIRIRRAAGTGRISMADDVRQPREFGPIEQQALEHVWIHSARWLDLAERDGLRVLVRGEGSTLWDARGNAYLDGLAGLYLVNVGHGRREIGEAIAEQATQLAYTSSAAYTNLAAGKLA